MNLLISDIKRNDLKEYLDEELALGNIECERNCVVSYINLNDLNVYFPKQAKQILNDISESNPYQRCNLYVSYRGGWDVIYKFVHAIEICKD